LPRTAEAGALRPCSPTGELARIANLNKRGLPERGGDDPLIA
jgi:hypothetical protein